MNQFEIKRFSKVFEKGKITILSRIKPEGEPLINLINDLKLSVF